MKDACEFVRHAILNRKFDERLSLTQISEETMQTNNGVVIASSPFPAKWSIAVDNIKLLKALSATDYAPTVKTTEKAVMLSSGRFRTRIPCSSEVFLTEEIKANSVKLKKSFIDTIKLLYPLLSEDASREWSQSVLVRKGKAYVTNNIIVGRVKLNAPDCVLPVELLSVVTRIKLTPKTIAVSGNAVQIGYGKGRWIQCKLKGADWPDLGQLFKLKGKLTEISEEFRHAVECIGAFVEEDVVSVKDKELVAADTTVYCGDVPDGCFSYKHLCKVLEAFTHADFSSTVVRLKGEGITGAFAQRME